MYKKSEKFNYYDSVELDAQVLEIPFVGEEASMTFVLPNKKEGLAVLEKQIDKVLETPKYTKEWVQVVLPKFKVESTIDFNPILEKVKEGFIRVTNNLCCCSWESRRHLMF
jgi:serpin B